MHYFYEAWKDIEANSVAGTTEMAQEASLQMSSNSVVSITELQKRND